jgi:hypothetical protein
MKQDTMKALKQIAGILLATFGVIFILSLVVGFFEPEPLLWTVCITLAVLGLLSLSGAFVLLRETVTAPSRSVRIVAARNGRKPVSCGVHAIRGYSILAVGYLDLSGGPVGKSSFNAPNVTPSISPIREARALLAFWFGFFSSWC